MYKLLIVDDEELIRQGLKKTIMQNEGNICLIEEAENGLAALEKIKTSKYDVVITDIRMPVMDGLEMIESIRKADTDISFIIISGYDDFTYAKKAIKYNVEDYILKPIDENEFIELLNKIFEKRSSRFRNLDEKNDYIRISNILKSLIYDNTDKSKFAGMIDLITERLDHGYFYIAVTYLYDMLKDLSDSFDLRRIIHFFNMHLNNEAGQKSFIFENKPGELVCIINPDTPETSLITEKLESICRDIRQDAGFCMSIGLSTCFGSIYEIKRGYNEASSALLIKLYKNDKTVYSAGEFNDFSSVKKINTETYKKEFIEHLSIGNRENAIELVNSLFCEFSEYCIYPVEVLKTLNSLLTTIQQELARVDELTTGMVDEYIRRLEILGSCCSMQELKDFMIKVVMEIFNIMVSRKDDECRKIIELSKNRIRNNCFSDLTLKTVAESIQMSPAYFSYLFKKETGLNFVDYVTEVKMEKAKELLSRNPELKIYEIADRLGYKDVKYFNRVFKKINSLTPGEYREKISL